MRATGIEIDPEYHAQALARLAQPEAAEITSEGDGDLAGQLLN